MLSYRCSIESFLQLCVGSPAVEWKIRERFNCLSQQTKGSSDGLSFPWRHFLYLPSPLKKKKTKKLTQTHLIPDTPIFEFVPSGRWYRAQKTHTNRRRSSFYARIAAFNTAILCYNFTMNVQHCLYFLSVYVS